MVVVVILSIINIVGSILNIMVYRDRVTLQYTIRTRLLCVCVSVSAYGRACVCVNVLKHVSSHGLRRWPMCQCLLLFVQHFGDYKLSLARQNILTWKLKLNPIVHDVCTGWLSHYNVQLMAQNYILKNRLINMHLNVGEHRMKISLML